MPCKAASTYELESHLSLLPAEMPPEHRSLAPFPWPEQRCPETLVTSSLQPSGESQKKTWLRLSEAKPRWGYSCPFVVQTRPHIPPAFIRENPCSSVAKKTPVALHPRTPVRGSPDEHTPCVIFTSRLRVSPNDPKPPALTL